MRKLVLIAPSKDATEEDRQIVNDDIASCAHSPHAVSLIILPVGWSLLVLDKPPMGMQSPTDPDAASVRASDGPGIGPSVPPPPPPPPNG